MSNYKNYLACSCENGKILLVDSNLKFIKIFGLQKIEEVPKIRYSKIMIFY